MLVEGGFTLSSLVLIDNPRSQVPSLPQLGTCHFYRAQGSAFVSTARHLISHRTLPGFLIAQAIRVFHSAGCCTARSFVRAGPRSVIGTAHRVPGSGT